MFARCNCFHYYFIKIYMMLFDGSCVFHQCVQLSLVPHKWSVWILFASVSLVPSGRMMNVSQVENKYKHTKKQNNLYLAKSKATTQTIFILTITLLAPFLSAQVFPGQLHFTEQEFLPQMANRSSAEFRNKATEIETQVSYKFTDLSICYN